MITYFDILNPIARPQPQTRRRPPNQPRRPTSRRNKKNGAVDMRRLDGVLQDLGFAPKPHPSIFLENEPNALFDGLEKFQKSNGLTVDGAVRNKESETGRALNKAMEKYYEAGNQRRAAAIQEAQRPTKPSVPGPDRPNPSKKPGVERPKLPDSPRQRRKPSQKEIDDFSREHPDLLPAEVLRRLWKIILGL